MKKLIPFVYFKMKSLLFSEYPVHLRTFKYTTNSDNVNVRLECVYIFKPEKSVGFVEYGQDLH